MIAKPSYRDSSRMHILGAMLAVLALGVGAAEPAAPARAAAAPADPIYDEADVPRVIGPGGGAVGGNGRLAIVPYAMKLPPGIVLERPRIAGHPDLSGIYSHALRAWQNPPPTIGVGPGVFGVPTPVTIHPLEGGDVVANRGDFRSPILRPWAAALIKAQGDSDADGKPFYRPCGPQGPLVTWARPGTVQILQTPNRVILLYKQYNSRIIYMNGKHPANVRPSVYGHSIGRWEGDTLVVDTIGLDGKAPLDRFGTPGTERTHIVERINLVRGGRVLEVEFQVDDPLVFTQSWSSTLTYARAEKMEEEDVCQEAIMFNHPF